VYRLRAST